MEQEKLEKILKEHGNLIKIIIGVIAFFSMIMAIKAYTNYGAIIDEEEKVKTEISNTEEEIAYSENFYKKYLDSDFSAYFLAHKNNSLFEGEKIIRLINSDDQEVQEQEKPEKSTTGNINTPSKARKLFFQSKIQ